LLQAIELKALETYNRIRDFVRSERGQTTAEYVAVTAVAVAIAVGVLWATLGGAINTAIEGIAEDIGNAGSGVIPGGEGEGVE
jgi:Flp pilus assembly pilin Flp